MRRLVFHIAISLLTFWVGIAFAGGLNLLFKMPNSATSILDCERESNSDAKPLPSSAERELLEIYQQYAVAQTNHDRPSSSKLKQRSSCCFPVNKSLTRTEDIRLMNTLDPNVTYTIDDLHVQLYGNSAIVRGRMTATTNAGTQYSWPWIDVCVRRSGRWQILSTTQVN